MASDSESWALPNKKVNKLQKWVQCFRSASLSFNYLSTGWHWFAVHWCVFAPGPSYEFLWNGNLNSAAYKCYSSLPASQGLACIKNGFSILLPASLWLCMFFSPLIREAIHVYRWKKKEIREESKNTNNPARQRQPLITYQYISLKSLGELLKNTNGCTSPLEILESSLEILIQVF